MTVETTKMEAFLLCQKEARGDLGKSLVADSLTNVGGVGVLYDLSEFGYARLGSKDLNDLYIWRYELSDDDELRKITGVTPSTGAVTVDRAWTDTDNRNYVLIGFDPRLVLDAMDAAYRRLTLRKDIVLTIGGADFDMEDTNENSWNGYLSGASVLKEQALPENKVTGEWSLKITLTANGGSLLSLPVRAVPGEQLDLAICLRIDTGGPFTVRLWDETHSAYFGDTQSYAGAEFAFLLIRNATVPDGCYFWQLEIAGTTSGDVAYLDSVAARPQGSWRFTLPSSLDESYKLPLIHRMRFTQSIPNASNQYAATKMQVAGDLVLDTHYHLEVQHGEANPYVVEIEPTVKIGTDELFYLATRRDRYLTEPWDNKTDPTTAPRSEIIANCMYDICDLLLHETHDPFWSQKGQEWGERLGQEVKARPDVAYQPEREVLVIKR